MKNKYVFLFIILLIISGCTKDTPVSSGPSGPFLYGKVIDTQGNPVDSVGFHYIFEYVTPGLGKTAKTCPSTHITFALQERSYVRLEVLRWYTREYIATLVDDTLEAGTHGAMFNASGITNGVYVYRLLVNDAALEKAMALLDLDYSTLVQAKPLVVSNASGEFSIPLGVFALGIPFTQTSAAGPDSLITTFISPTITAVLYKPGYFTVTKSITIDTTKNMTEQFQFNR